MGFVESLGYKITSLNTTDYIAQHPANGVQIDFIFSGNGVINMQRVR